MNNINYRRELLHHKIHRHAKHHVHRLREKSDTHKKLFAFSFAFIFTLMVFVLWYFLSLPKILGEYKTLKAENERLNENILVDFKNIFTGKGLDDDAQIEKLDNIEIKQ